QNGIGDYVEFSGIQANKVKAFRLSNPDRIVLDFSDTLSQIGKQSQTNTLGQYVTSIRTAQFDATTTRIVLETDGQADYEISQSGASTTRIQLLEPSYENINYENNEELPIITLENASQIPLNEVTYEDDYNDGIFIIHLPGNYASLFGDGGIQVDDASISSIDIVTNGLGYTDLVIHENDIYVFRMESDGDRVYIKAYKPREIYSQIVVLDFGHGGKDPGAIGKGLAPGGGNLQEKDVNLAIGNFARAYLEADPNIKVYYTRQDDTYVSLQARTDIGNKVEADFFVSIHNNANQSSSIAGSETLYFKDADRPGLNSVELARILQNRIVAALGLFNRGVKDDNGLFILRNSDMPAIILEEGFVTNVNDSKKLGDPIYQDAIAKAIYEGIVETFAKYPTGR
ncbi:MAG: N-acetylmuramoyl-L-alanine amidase, partial [Vallitaleaceae bacterium]|nr:N-acetylmuramoyl-L-alanine amidase [Vallitaleaceae bacterium]